MSKHLNWPLNKTQRQLLNTTTDIKNIVRNRILNILLPKVNSKYFNIQYGLDLRKYLFQQDSEVQRSMINIKKQIIDKLYHYISQFVIINDIDILINSEQTRINIILKYTIKLTQQPVTLQLTNI